MTHIHSGAVLVKSFKRVTNHILCFVLLSVLFFCITVNTIASASESEDIFQKLITAGRLQRCVELSERIIADQPDFIKSQSELALSLFMLDHYEKAIAAINKIFSSAQNNLLDGESKVNLLALRGSCYYKLGQYDKALVDFSDALKIPDCPPEIAKGRALVYEKLGNQEKALADKEKGGNATPYQNQFDMDRLQSYGVPLIEIPLCSKFPGKGSLDKWQQALKLAKEARTLEADNQLDKAIDNYKTALELYSHDGSLYACLGLCYMTRKANTDRATAITAFKKALTLNDSNGQIWSDLGSVLYESPDSEDKQEDNSARRIEAKNAFQMALSKSKDLEQTQQQALVECIRIVNAVPKLMEQLKQMQPTEQPKNWNGAAPDLNSSPTSKQMVNPYYMTTP
jgi:tetratricopeptide (TPR) repeat protein